MVHNRYQQAGGEDAVADAEARLLERLGHRVVRYERHNDDVRGMPPLHLAATTVWSRRSHRELERLAAEVKPDVAHLHNTFPLLSPAAHHALHASGAAVVQTLHNYRLLCPQGQFLREGTLCESCLGKAVPWPGVVHGCYRESRAATAAIAAMLTTHRAIGTWTDRVHAFIALSEFAREQFRRGGLPANRLHVKRNFIDPDPGVGAHDGGFLLYVGRLSEEKGVRTLLEAWRRVGDLLDPSHFAGESAPELVVVGDGPLAAEVAGVVAAAQATLSGIRRVGAQPRDVVLDLMGRARALVFPSESYENSPLVLAEAFARGLPVIGSRLGSTAELVREGETGRPFEAWSAEALANAMAWALDPRTDLAPLQRGARSAYERDHSLEAAGDALLEVYRAAQRERR